jgi:hypothetical protein
VRAREKGTGARAAGCMARPPSDAELFANAPPRRPEPDAWWYCWSFLNNERVWLLFNYFTASVLMAAAAILVVDNANFVSPSGDGYLPVMWSESLYSAVDSTDCTFLSGDGAQAFLELFVPVKKYSAGQVAMILFVSLEIFLLAVAVLYAWFDLRKKVEYRKMERFWRGLLFTCSVILPFVALIAAMIGVYGVHFYYSDDAHPCWPRLLEQISAAGGLNASYAASLQKAVSANKTASNLVLATLALDILNVFLYGSLFVVTRTWADTRKWDPVRMQEEERTRRRRKIALV